MSIGYDIKGKCYMRDTEPVVITKAYIDKHKTKRGAWTKVQIEALGLEWPPTNGWKDRLVGEILNPDGARRFEQGKSMRANTKQSFWDLGKNIIKNGDKLTDNQLARLYEFAKAEMFKRKLIK